MSPRLSVLSYCAVLAAVGCVAAPQFSYEDTGLQAQVDALQATVEELQWRFIDEDITLNVPAEHADIQAALDALHGRVISGAATVTIQVADGSYSYAEPIVVGHANGDRIHIVGNTTDPTQVKLTFAAGGFEVTRGRRLGLLQGMTLVGDGEGKGVLANDGAVVTVSGVTTENFVHGYSTWYGATLYADGTQDSGSLYSYWAWAAVLSAQDTVSNEPVYAGYDAERGAYIDANRAEVTGAGRYGFYSGASSIDAEYSRAQGCQTGYFSSSSGTIDAHGSEATQSEMSGFQADHGGVMVSTSAEANDNGGSGFYCARGGVLYAIESRSNSNDDYGFEAVYGGLLFAASSSSTNEATGYSPAVSTDSQAEASIWR